MSFSKIFIAQLSDPLDAEGRGARRILVSSEALKGTKLTAGDPVALVAAQTSNANGARRAFAVGALWPSHELESNGTFYTQPTGCLKAKHQVDFSLSPYAFKVIQASISVLATAQVDENSKVQLYPLNPSQPQKLPSWLPSLKHVKEAGSIRLKEIYNADEAGPSVPKLKAADKQKRQDWLTLLVRELLIDLKYVTASQVVEVSYEGRTRRFSISLISRSTAEGEDDPVTDLAQGFDSLSMGSLPPLATVSWQTTVTLQDEIKQTKSSEKKEIEVLGPSASPQAYVSVGGLDKQIAQIRDLIEIPLTRPDLFRHFGLKPPRGLLLYGPPGTGKTHLARAIAASTQSSVLIVNGPELTSAYHGETEASLRKVFADARVKAPCIIVLDEVDAICPRREEGAGGEVEKRVVATLLTEMDGVEGDVDARVVVVATTNRPNAIDPALRRPGRFDREIEIGIPDLDARISIMNVLLSKTPHTVSPEELRAVASRAHGYVGADLAAVVREAGTLAIKRYISSSSSTETPSPTSIHLTSSDLDASLPTIRPSALRAHFLDMAPVRFSEIGGLSSTIARLRESVEWPLIHGATLARLGVTAPKGVLLCGPPGCSKTVLARATATESGVNFVAVRGPELLNKYLGESEKAVREIFRKARAAAPSIIFFDEIDALAISRSSGSEGGSHEGVLTSLLNEMDGVEELVGVTVVGATNRPEVIDPALMRPGRLDRILYVGPPDHAGRIEILKIRMRKMSVAPDVDFEELATLTDGCSGAEITSMCQEAALLTMQKDLEAAYVPHSAFVAASRNIKKQITPEMLQRFQRWRGDSGLASI